MPRRPSSAHIIKVLLLHGFVLITQNGSHAKFAKGSRRVIVPVGKRVTPIGTFLSIVQQSGLHKEDFQGKSAK